MSRAGVAVARLAAGVALAACASGAGDASDSSAAPAALPATPTVSAVPESSSAPDSAPQAAPATPAPSPVPPTRPVGAAAATGDSVRGIVAVVGSAPMTQLVVRPAGGGPSVTITGDTAGLRTLSGADVMVSGTRAGARELRATSFVVRTVDGLPAADGVLERSGDGYVLRLADGTRRALVRPPAALIAHVGARVWVTGAANAEPQSFGVISH